MLSKTILELKTESGKPLYKASVAVPDLSCVDTMFFKTREAAEAWLNSYN